MGLSWGYHWADIDILITGTEVDDAMLDAVRGHGVDVITV